MLVDIIGEEEHLVVEAQSTVVRVHDARRTSALLSGRKHRQALDEFRRGAQLVHQRGKAFIVTPTGGGGVQATHLLVGRCGPVGVHRSRARVQEHMTGEVRYLTLEHSERSDEGFPRVIPREHVVGRAGDERRDRAEPLEERSHCRGDLAREGAG